MVQAEFDALAWTVLPTPQKLCIAEAGPQAGLIGAAAAARTALADAGPALAPAEEQLGWETRAVFAAAGWGFLAGWAYGLWART